MSVYQEAYHLPEFTYDYEKLKIEQRGPVYICSFNDADNLNAMSYAQMAEFNDFLIKVRMDKDCRVIVLTGEGRSFCAGFNLNDLALDPPEDMGRIQRDFYIMQRMCSDQIINMRRCEQPIIGALKGFAVGGGLSISCACDMRVLGESYKMNAGYLSIGYTGTDMGVPSSSRRSFGYARACEILMNPPASMPRSSTSGASPTAWWPTMTCLRPPWPWPRRCAARPPRSVCASPRRPCSARWTAPASRTASRWRTATRCWPPTPTTASWAR